MALSVFLAVSLPALSAPAQNINQTVQFEDFGFTFPLTAAARPAGMAGTYTSCGDDVHSLLYNPAGLARIKRIEFSAGLQEERHETENVYFGSARTADVRVGGFDALSVAYPLPTFRGSLVAALGVYRSYSSNLDIVNAGQNTVTNTTDNYLLQQTGALYSYNLGIAGDLGPNFSGGLSMFILDGNIESLLQIDYTTQDVPRTGQPQRVTEKQDVSVDIRGVGGRAGVQFFVHRLLRGGVSLTTPVLIKARGVETKEETMYFDNSIDVFDVRSRDVDDDYLVPFRVDVGLAFTPANLLLAVELGYSDWTGASINRKRFQDGNLETTFREVVDFRVGAEVTIPVVPVRVRGGYARRPYALNRLQANRKSNDDIQIADIDRELRMFTLGVGGLIGRNVTVEAAYVHMSGERSVSTLSDSRSTSRFLATVSYRL